jgi:hypothetical protein
LGLAKKKSEPEAFGEDLYHHRNVEVVKKEKPAGEAEEAEESKEPEEETLPYFGLNEVVFRALGQAFANNPNSDFKTIGRKAAPEFIAREIEWAYARPEQDLDRKVIREKYVLNLQKVLAKILRPYSLEDVFSNAFYDANALIICSMRTSNFGAG